ncbi:MAG: IS630 family transposase [Limisphaerales bacterium]
MDISLPDARQLSDEVLEALRLRAIHGCQMGYTEYDLGQLLGVARETVCQWWTAFTRGGLDALPHERTGRPQGSGAALSDEQGNHIQELLRDHQPQQLGIPAPLWTRRAVGELIRRECGVHLAVRTVGKYLRRWGFTPKRPRRHSRQQDPEEVRQWLEEIYPAIEERAQKEGATIHWCDEVGVAADQFPGRGYAPQGEPATVDVPGPHVRANQISAISNRGQVHFMTYTGSMTAAVFLLFLSRLLRQTTGKLFLIVDRLPAHWTAKVMAWVEARSDRLEMFELPTHAPELNPDEYLNNDLKGGVNAVGLPNDSAGVRSRIQDFMRRLLHLPSHVRSYFQHPQVQYAAELV